MRNNNISIFKRELSRVALILALSLIVFAGTGQNSFAETMSQAMTPAEDLMTEHGATRRIMLVMENYLCRFNNPSSIQIEPLRTALQLNGQMAKHHATMEEQHIFPLFEKSADQAELIRTLREQHQLVMRLNTRMMDLASQDLMNNVGIRQELADNIKEFIDMYRAHTAFEDTRLFPQLRTMLSEAEYQNLGNIFEQQATRDFGSNPHQRISQSIMNIEKSLGLDNLAIYNPRLIQVSTQR